jgi:hypothetical protein
MVAAPLGKTAPHVAHFTEKWAERKFDMDSLEKR